MAESGIPAQIWRMKRAAILLLFAVLVPHRGDEPVAGVARVIDGDTIEISETRVRLWESTRRSLAQRCTVDGALYPCGFDASRALAKYIGRRDVTCTHRDTDRYRRMVAVCTVDGVDISRWMVQQGQAIAFRKYTLDHFADEVPRGPRIVVFGLASPGPFRLPTSWASTFTTREPSRLSCPENVDRVGHRCGGRSVYAPPRPETVCAGR